MILLLGAIGGILILLAWIFETEESVRKHKKFLDLRFTIVYFFGLAFLTIYAYIIGDPVFFWLEVAILAMVLFEIFYTHFRLSKSKKRKKR